MPDGSKRFLSGSKMKGGYHIIQQVKDAPVVICEGFATGATLAEHYCQYSTVICAFNAGNLYEVARWFRQSAMMHQLTIAGDNDHANKINTGADAAKKAALALGCMVSLPEFSDDEKGSDWNDRYILDMQVIKP
jgi:putative DNA primase/helicase